MVINQLFNEKPPLDLLLKIIKTFGLKDMKDNTEFTILDLARNNTVTQLKTFDKELREIYLPCKQKLYLDNITNKSAINILRQLLKVYDHDLVSHEKFIKGTKYLVYKITTKEEKEFNKKRKNIPKKEIVIIFD